MRWELFSDLPSGELQRVLTLARRRTFGRGEVVFHEGDPADSFYVIREGAVAIETEVPGRGAVVMQTLHDGELLGWSWLVPPYRTAFDAR